MTDDVPRETTTSDWGLNSRGKPYKRDPASYASRRRNSTGGTAPKRRATPNRVNSEAVTQQRAQSVFDVLTVPVAGLAVAGQAANSKPLIADAIILGRAAPQIATAVAQVADQDDRVAAIVDKLVQTSPYAALFTAIIPVVVQVAANHSPKLVGVARMAGAQSVDDIIASATEPAPAPGPGPAPAEQPKVDPLSEHV